MTTWSMDSSSNLLVVFSTSHMPTTHLFIYIAIGDLQEPARYCTHEANPRAEGYSPCTCHVRNKRLSTLGLTTILVTFGIFHFRITVYTSVTHIPISRVENVCQLGSFEWAWDTTDENGLSWVDGLGVVHDEVAIREFPWAHLDLGTQ